MHLAGWSALKFRLAEVHWNFRYLWLLIGLISTIDAHSTYLTVVNAYYNLTGKVATSATKLKRNVLSIDPDKSSIGFSLKELLAVKSKLSEEAESSWTQSNCPSIEAHYNVWYLLVAKFYWLHKFVLELSCLCIVFCCANALLVFAQVTLFLWICQQWNLLN